MNLIFFHGCGAENTETYYEINKLECQIEVKRASQQTSKQPTKQATDASQAD